jgi:hypothetical protein
MPKTTTNKGRKLSKGVTLHPLTFEQAVRLALKTPLPENERRKRRKKPA